MMNLLARILSHGFAIAIVLLLAIGLIYRGELFPEWELPEFLAIDTPTETGEAEGVKPAAPETKPVPAEPVPAAEDEAPQAEPVVTAGSQPVEAAAVADTEEASAAAPAAEAEPDTPQPAPALETPAPEAPAADAVEQAATAPAITEHAPPPTDVPAAMPEAVEVVEAIEAVEEPAAATPAGEAIQESTQRDESVTTEAIRPSTAEADTTIPEAVEAAPEPAAPAVNAIEESAPAPTSAVTPEAVPTAGDAVATQPVVPVPETTSLAPDRAAIDTAVEADTGTAAVAEPPVADEAVQPAVAPPQEEPQPPAAMETAAPANSYEVLAAAREAYWLRDYETAENKYRQLIALEPDNPDGYGELGNMYFSQGRWEQAAAAYFEAGTRLVKEGQLQQARELVDVIRGLDGAQADALDSQIAAARAPTP